MSRYKELLKDNKLMSGIYAVTLITALLILALVVKGPEESGKLLSDGSGNITGIRRKSMDRSERYDLSIEIEDGSRTVTRDVTLTLQAEADGRSSAGMDGAERRDAEIDAEVDSMISSIEYSRERKIRLPSALPDGTAVRWKAAERRAVHYLELGLLVAQVVVALHNHQLEHHHHVVTFRSRVALPLLRQ